MKRIILVVVAVVIFAGGRALAEVKLNALFSNSVVLQQGQPVPVWGTAKDGEKVTVQFAGQTVRTTAKDGQWKVKLKPLKASATPQTMTITGENTVEVNDVLVGEVWVCSGQSNMEWTLSMSAEASRALPEAGDSQLRLFQVPRTHADQPCATVAASWSLCASNTVAGFSAVGYQFGRQLRAKLGVPVGLIQAAWGGTRAEAWTARAKLEAQPELNYVLKEQETDVANYSQRLEKYRNDEPELLKKWEEAAAEAKAAQKTPPRKPTAPADPRQNHQRPSALYNGMIAPLQPFAIRGVIWYQGESNASRAKLYRTLFPAMIASWREAWGQGEFPFLFVQIAPCNGQPPEIREAQLLTWQKTPKTAMAVITDFGDAKDIHPRKKEPVGARLALAARAIAYGEKIEYSGPVFAAMQVRDGKAVLKFTHAKSGLVAKDGELKGFTIAGADKKFVPATAKIEGQTVVVSSDAVAQPVAVRYGWENAPDVNLFNKADLPASPFRTDVE